MRTVFTLLLCALIVNNAAAQDFRGAITGRIVDTSGARIPGVTVTATNVATNIVSTTISNEEGIYSIPYLNPGAYTVVAELAGFKKLVRDGIAVRIGDRLTLDLNMEVGARQETV